MLREHHGITFEPMLKRDVLRRIKREGTDEAQHVCEYGRPRGFPKVVGVGKTNVAAMAALLFDMQELQQRS